MTTPSAPRIRVFAGPNGSGKTTVLRELKNLGIPLYHVINPDDIERDLYSNNGFDIARFGVSVTSASFAKYVSKTTYSAKARRAANRMRIEGNTMHSVRAAAGSYNAALVSAYLRSRLIAQRASYTFESVLSHGSKIEELKKALDRGYRIYLYYVSTDAVEVAKGRVAERVANGGHAVPPSKIESRYPASLANLLPALELAYRAYIFDNSGTRSRLLAEQTPQGNLNLKLTRMPVWFYSSVIEPLQP